MRIAQLRQARKMTQEALANEVGVSQAHLSRIENGTGSVSLTALKRIAEELDVSLADLFLDNRSSAEEALLRAFRSLPEERQRGWLDMAETIATDRATPSQ